MSTQTIKIILTIETIGYLDLRSAVTIFQQKSNSIPRSTLAQHCLGKWDTARNSVKMCKHLAKGHLYQHNVFEIVIKPIFDENRQTDTVINTKDTKERGLRRTIMRQKLIKMTHGNV